MDLGFNIEPDERIEDFEFYLEATGERATELEDVMHDIIDRILGRNKRAFETRGATTGVYWAPLKDTTVRRKSKLPMPYGMPFDPLRRGGDLEESLTVKHHWAQTLEVDDSGFLLGTKLEYAEHHASGTEHMPARPPMVIAAKHSREYIGMINDFIFGEGEYA